VASPLASGIMVIEAPVFRNALLDFAYRLVPLLGRSRMRGSCQESVGTPVTHQPKTLTRIRRDLNQNSPQRALKGVDGPANGDTADVPKNHAVLATVIEVGLYSDLRQAFCASSIGPA